ncbi:MAG TPA: hypothetical protein VES89_04230 [Candidatus Competibacteraceae bacterium]|nr:hypothetical protein [Candidatus Competibacteraceae bacterium]
MLVHRFHHADLATTQGGARYPTRVTARLNRDDFSAKVLECAPLTLEEVTDFLELESSPESQHGAARALAYATTFDSPLDRMVGFTLACAWVAATLSALLRQSASWLRLRVVVSG